jgi:LysM repeat protein
MKSSNISWSILLSSSFFVGAVFALTSCSNLSSSREQRHATEFTLHTIRTEIEDLKHDLNTSDIELHILEGKLIDQEETIGMLKEQLLESHGGKIEDLQQLLSTFNKKISSIEKRQEELVVDLRQLASHANETTTALSQYKDKICEMEKTILFQNKKFEELTKLRKNLENLSIETAKNELQSYTIKEGDSLQKISKQFSVPIEDLKKVNHLKDDLIFSGQTIVVPKSQQPLP